MPTVHDEIRQHKLECAVFLAENRGILSFIARELGVSPQFVQQVMRKIRSSSDGRIERMLRKYKVPGFDQ
jgi:phage portal protein BeeE